MGERGNGTASTGLRIQMERARGTAVPRHAFIECASERPLHLAMPKQLRNLRLFRL